MRFKAPKHTTAVHLSTGPVEVKDGAIEVPDDTPLGDLNGLAANGFTLEPAEPTAAPSKPTTGAVASDNAKDG